MPYTSAPYRVTPRSNCSTNYSRHVFLAAFGGPANSPRKKIPTGKTQGTLRVNARVETAGTFATGANQFENAWSPFAAPLCRNFDRQPRRFVDRRSARQRTIRFNGLQYQEMRPTTKRHMRDVVGQLGIGSNGHLNLDGLVQRVTGTVTIQEHGPRTDGKLLMQIKLPAIRRP